MNMENFTSVFNSADGPTSIFVAGKTPEIMGVLIAIVVVGVIISLFGLKLVRVLSAMMGLGTGAVIGAVIGCLVWKLRKTFRKRKSGKIRIGRKADTEVSQVKLQDHDHMQGGEKDNPAPDQRKQ